MCEELRRKSVGTSRTAYSCFSDRVQAVSELVLKSPDLLLSRVGSGAVAARNRW
jgi:hypothetical protein